MTKKQIDELYNNNARRINAAIADVLLTEPKMRAVFEEYLGHSVSDDRIREWRRENTDEPEPPTTTPDGGVKLSRGASDVKK